MAALATQTVTQAGLAPTYAAGANGGDTCNPGDNVMLHVKNTSGGAITVTVTDQLTPVPGGSAAVNNLVKSVPATTGDVMIGPINAARFARASDGQAVITYSTNPPTGLTLAVVAGPSRG